MAHTNLLIEVEQNEDGRWVAELPILPGVRAYGENRAEAISHIHVLALRTVADQLEAA